MTTDICAGCQKPIDLQSEQVVTKFRDGPFRAHLVANYCGLDCPAFVTVRGKTVEILPDRIDRKD